METIDAWVLGKYQYAADWVYTRNRAISPYWLAAQSFAVSSLFVVMFIAVKMEMRQNWFYMFIVGIQIPVMAFAYHHTMKRHAAWLKHRLTSPISDIIFARRMFLVLATLAWAIPLLSMVVPVGKVDGADWLFSLYHTFMVTGYYFESCMPPTPMQRRQGEMIPQPIA